MSGTDLNIYPEKTRVFSLGNTKSLRIVLIDLRALTGRVSVILAEGVTRLNRESQKDSRNEGAW